jgi:hypothetical protein
VSGAGVGIAHDAVSTAMSLRLTFGHGSVSVAKSIAAAFSFSAFTTWFIVARMSSGGSISFSSVLTISMPQCAVSSRSACWSPLLVGCTTLIPVRNAGTTTAAPTMIYGLIHIFSQRSG